MSKRSSRRRRREKEKSRQTRLTGPALVESGLEAFRQASYDEAIGAWEQAQRKGNTPAKLPAALAEAYFRRAVSRPESSIDDMERAVELRSKDQTYRYHLALAYHRSGELDRAEKIYRRLLAESPPFERAAEPLAQLLVERRKALSQDSASDHLAPESRRELAAAEALVREKADSTLSQLAEEPVHPLWQGLIAIALDDRAEAREKLQAALDSPGCFSPTARGVARYYLGLLAVENDQPDQAFEQWQAALADGFDAVHLRRNQSALAYRLAVQAQQAGQASQAADLLDQAGHLQGLNGDLRLHLQWGLGYAAAQKGDWGQALKQWEQVEEAGDDSRRLLLNLALAYQNTEHYLEAADRWRTLIRRRPRKSDHPDALTDEQVARVWENIAENYSKGGDYEEAVKTYKNAVKWAPDNLKLRLKLVDALETEGRWQAAENELHRILEKDPDHVPALTALAEIYAEDYRVHQARRILLRILELEPQNPVARSQLALMYEREGDNMARWGMYDRALEIYQEGLEQVPDNPRLHISVGQIYAGRGEFDKTRSSFEKAIELKPNDLSTLYNVFLTWLRYESDEDLEKVFERIKGLTVKAPGGFFLDLIDECLAADEMELVEALLEIVEERFAGDEQTLIDLALRYIQLEQLSKGLSILRSIVKNNPNHAQANLRLGLVYHRMGQTRLAKRHWQKAETQARKEKNVSILFELHAMRNYLAHGRSAPQNPMELFMNLPPELREIMIEQAPPEVAEMLRAMPPEMLGSLMGAAMFGDIDEFFDFDEDDYYD